MLRAHKQFSPSSRLRLMLPLLLAIADPMLPPPDPRWIPKVQVAEATGWQQGQAPVPAAGFAVSA